MTTAEVYPFAEIHDAGSYPPWIRGLRKRSGVYLIREHSDSGIAYVGESSSDRLYSTLTRHFQRWSNKYDTAGATYDRGDVDVAVIVVPSEHANYLQNELICALDPADNRLRCDQLFEWADDEAAEQSQADEYRPTKDDPPPGYDYNVDLLLEGVAYQWPVDGDDGDDVTMCPSRPPRAGSRERA